MRGGRGRVHRAEHSVVARAAAAGLALVAIAASAAPAATADTAPPAVVGAPVSTSIILPLSLPITEGALVTADALAAATAPGAQLDAELTATIGSNVTYAIDPMLVASIRALGASAPATATDWLARLQAAPNPTFPLAWADSDLTAPIQAGRSSVLALDDASFAIDPSLFATPDPGATTAPGDDTLPPLPTAADLVAWNYTLPHAAWVMAGSATSRDLDVIAASGYSPTIVSSDNVQRTDDLAATVRNAQHTILVTDDATSTLFAAALGAADQDTWEQAVQALTASISTRSLASVSRTLIIALDRTAPIPTARLAATIAAIGQDDVTSLVGLPTLTAATTSHAVIVDQPQRPERISRVRTLLGDERRDARFATVADEPELIAGERRARLLVALSPGANDHGGGWFHATEDFVAESEALQGSVHLVRSSDLALFADNGSIPVTVRNTLDVPVTVYVEVRPSLPLVSIEDDHVEVRIEAGAQARASVPVEWLSNGIVDLTVSLSSAADVPIGTPEVVRTNVQAGWEGPVTIALGALVVAVFAFGILRVVLRRRAARRAG